MYIPANSCSLWLLLCCTVEILESLFFSVYVPIKRKILVGTLCLYLLREFVSCPSFPKPVFSWEAKGSGKAAEPEPSLSMMAKIFFILYGDFSYCYDGKFCNLQE